MKVLAIDPGTTDSAYVVWDGEKIYDKGKISNVELTSVVRGCDCDLMLVEMIASYGMPVGKEVFETVLYIGRLLEMWDSKGGVSELIYRKEIKMHHCGSMKAKDGNIRQALIDKYGAPGVKKSPGLTYGISSDVWSAFAIATYYTEKESIKN